MQNIFFHFFLCDSRFPSVLTNASIVLAPASMFRKSFNGSLSKERRVGNHAEFVSENLGADCDPRDQGDPGLGLRSNMIIAYDDCDYRFFRSLCFINKIDCSRDLYR